MIDRVCISLSSRCQLRCTYCHFDTRIKKGLISEISEEDAIKVIHNLYDYAVEHGTKIKIGLVGSGEPLMRFGLIKRIVELANEIDGNRLLSFYTISNGMRFDKDMCEFFFMNRDRIKLCFSLDGYERIHDLCRKMACGKGSYETLMRSIGMYRDMFGVSPSVNATVHRETLRHACEVLDFFEKNFSEVTFSRLVDMDGSPLFITKQDFNEFLELAHARNIAMRQFAVKKYDCTMYGKLCGVGRTNIYFDNGKVYPCGRFVGNTKYELGNLTDSINTIENFMKSNITPCADGECFYDNL